MKRSDTGVVYLIKSEGEVAPTVRSIRSVRDVHPELCITIFLSRRSIKKVPLEGKRSMSSPMLELLRSAKAENIRLRAVPASVSERAEVIHAWRHSPSDRTLFLGPDTFVRGKLDQLFDLLKNFSIVLAPLDDRAPHSKEVPDLWPLFDTAVFGFRRRPCQHDNRVGDVFDRIETLLHRMELPNAVRMGTYNGVARTVKLPEWYVLRARPAFIADGRACIIQGDTAIKLFLETPMQEHSRGLRVLHEAVV